MQTLDYRVFEYAESEFVKSGAVILIALRIEATSNHRVLGYLHSDWLDAVGKNHSFDLEYIEDFIYDLRQQDFKSSQEVSRYFHHIEEMSVGPLRTLSSGVQTLNSLSELSRALLEQSRGVNTCSNESFSHLFKDLTGYAAEG